MIKAIKVQLMLKDKERRQEILKAIRDIRYTEYKAMNKCLTFLYADTQEKLLSKNLGIEIPSDKERFGKTLAAYLYDVCLETMPDAGSMIVSAVARKAKSRFDMDKDSGLLRGDISLTTFKRDAAIFLPSRAVTLFLEKGKFFARLSFFNKGKTAAMGLKTGMIDFEIIRPDGNLKAVLNRIINGEYKLSECSLKESEGKWMLSIAFNMDAKETSGGNVLGIDIGIHNALALAVYDPKTFQHKRLSWKECIVSGGIVEEFRVQQRRRRRSYGIGSKLNASGKGYKKRNKRLLSMGQKEKNFRDTYNHKLSKYVVEEAIKHGCGLIQMEDLSGISSTNDKFLKNWAYYDLQNKIAYKAREHGIEVVKINPRYTTRRCSSCGNINQAINDTNIHEWTCPHCGAKHNRDENAAKNIAMPNIENIIQHQLDSTKAEQAS